MPIKVLLYDVFRSITESITRYFDNLFQPKTDDEKQWLRLELERERVERKKLYELLASPKIAAEIDTEPKEFEPIQTGRLPWQVRAKMRHEKEVAEFNKRKSNNTPEVTNSIAELEKELNVNG